MTKCKYTCATSDWFCAAGSLMVTWLDLTWGTDYPQTRSSSPAAWARSCGEAVCSPAGTCAGRAPSPGWMRGWSAWLSERRWRPQTARDDSETPERENHCGAAGYLQTMGQTASPAWSTDTHGVSIHLFLCAFWNIALKKTLDGNTKMCINSKNAHKKNLCAHLSRINFLSDKKKCTNYDANTLME